ncbi:TRAP transporter small permease [Elioraea sp.]|jgi:TRAP-type C4-dicarboxylate transport system permease small subunit|uniref:TRAP transporter small permease n=1 Tax=Elioraea sp. TaxID=2185103 RepID=UPI00307D4056
MTDVSAPGPLRRLADLYARALRVLLALSLGILVVPVTMQVISRFVPFIPHFIWTEEMARFLLVWMIMIGSVVGVREAGHFVVDLWPRLTRRQAAALDLVANAAILVLALAFLVWGWEYTEFAWWRISELAELPLWLIHIAWPVSGASWLIFAALHAADALRVLTGRDT